MTVYQNQAEQIGNTDLLKIESLSRLTGSDIYIKCEHQNPGGSIKDRAALRMVQDAMASGELKPGMSIVEGTAGNTGIGLALVAKALGFDMLTVMPSGQTPEKERMIQLHGAQLKLVAPCPFKDPAHFYHTAKRIGQENEDYWWANQFENLSNFSAHYEGTGPEIWRQTDGKISALVSVCGTGGTIAGCSAYLKTQNSNIKNWLVDPDGSGIFNYLKHGEYKSSGSSFTEGIGIMRLVENFKQAKLDHAVNLPDQDLVTLSRFVRDNDGIVLGSSSALNVSGAIFAAAKMGPGNCIVTFSCDAGERSFSKLYNEAYLTDREIDINFRSMEEMYQAYESENGPEYLTL